MIETFIKEMEEAHPDPILLADHKAEFEQWYKISYFNEWYEFGKKFPKGIELLNGKKEWQQMASIMASDNSPYFDVLGMMAEELSPFYDGFFGDEDLPSWVNLVFEFHIVKSQFENKSEGGYRGFEKFRYFQKSHKKSYVNNNQIPAKNGFGRISGGIRTYPVPHGCGKGI
jgi:hypothetical protein